MRKLRCSQSKHGCNADLDYSRNFHIRACHMADFHNSQIANILHVLFLPLVPYHPVFIHIRQCQGRFNRPSCFSFLHKSLIRVVLPNMIGQHR